MRARFLGGIRRPVKPPTRPEKPPPLAIMPLGATSTRDRGVPSSQIRRLGLPGEVIGLRKHETGREKQDPSRGAP
jgi:hypothetical protein